MSIIQTTCHAEGCIFVLSIERFETFRKLNKTMGIIHVNELFLVAIVSTVCMLKIEKCLQLLLSYVYMPIIEVYSVFYAWYAFNNGSKINCLILLS